MHLPVAIPETGTCSDFQRTFKPIAERTNVEWAVINRWKLPKKLMKETALIQPGHDDASRWSDVERSLESTSGSRLVFLHCYSSPAELLAEHLQRHGYDPARRGTRIATGLKSDSPYGTVQDVWSAHQEALDPRKVLNQLRDRQKFPWKTLAFDQQVRPPYSGTFTKRSTTVGPRTPFAQDPIFDYSYDSGDEWQDDEGGDDVDDFDEVAGLEEEETENESEGEFDDWLDDADDVPYIPMEVDVDQATNPFPTMDQSRLAMKVVKRLKDVPRKLVKLTPYWKGPIWESASSKRAEEMQAYRLQLLNGK